MIRRTFDASLVNGFLNHPSIRPTVGGEGFLDSTDLLADRRNVCLISAGGGMLFRWSGPGVFDTHVFMAVRGQKALRITRDMLACMGREFGAQHLWALIPKASRNVQWFARQCGMQSLGPITAPDGEHQLFEMRF